MHLQKITTRLLSYNYWAIERLTVWLLNVDRRMLYTTTPSSFGTIDLTLQHMLSAEVYWYSIISKGEITEFNQPPKENAVAEVMQDLVSSSQRLASEWTHFTEDELLQVIKASDSAQCRYEYILHLVNHGSYHRGQVVCMCRALNITGEIPVTDYDAYLWWIENM